VVDERGKEVERVAVGSRDGGDCVLREAAGDGNVAARITRNGKQIWPTTGAAQLITGSDTTGYTTDLTLPVNAGDAVRFEVSSADPGTPPGSPTAWVPTIAYQ